MNVHQAAGERLEDFTFQDAHESSEHDELDAVVAAMPYDLGLGSGTQAAAARARIDNVHGDLEVSSDGDGRRGRIIGDKTRDDAGEGRVLAALSERFEIASPP